MVNCSWNIFSDSAEASNDKKSGDEEDDENFEDAEDDDEDVNTGAIGKQLMQNGIQSPDSGIHGDKSATELTLST